jgi:hypothetical protein
MIRKAGVTSPQSRRSQAIAHLSLKDSYENDFANASFIAGRVFYYPNDA